MGDFLRGSWRDRMAARRPACHSIPTTFPVEVPRKTHTFPTLVNKNNILYSIGVTKYPPVAVVVVVVIVVVAVVVVVVENHSFPRCEGKNDFENHSFPRCEGKNDFFHSFPRCEGKNGFDNHSFPRSEGKNDFSSNTY